LGEEDGEKPGEEAAVEEEFDFSDLQLRAEVQPADLPTLVLKDISAQYSESLNAVWSFMSVNPEGAPLPPLTYLQIGASHVGAIKHLLGEVAWRGFYQSQAVEPTRLVPWQILLLIRYALKKAEKDLKVCDGTEQAAAAVICTAKADAKRRRYCPW
jgi:hypothetical protein